MTVYIEIRSLVKFTLVNAKDERVPPIAAAETTYDTIDTPGCTRPGTWYDPLITKALGRLFALLNTWNTTSEFTVIGVTAVQVPTVGAFGVK